MKKRLLLLLSLLLVLSMTITGCGSSSQPSQAPKNEGGQVGDYGPPAEVTKWVFQPVFDSS